MKIIEDSEQRLIVEDRPWFLGLLLIFFLLIAVRMIFAGVERGDVFMLIAGPAFVVGILWALAKSVRRARLILERPSNTATWRVRDYKGLSERSWPLDLLENAMVEEERNDGVGYRVSLKFADEKGRFPLTPYFSGFGQHRTVAERINAFIQH